MVRITSPAGILLGTDVFLQAGERRAHRRRFGLNFICACLNLIRACLAASTAVPFIRDFLHSGATVEKGVLKSWK
jgi:hypothetical protein